jgi:hypothetical protein
VSVPVLPPVAAPVPVMAWPWVAEKIGLNREKRTRGRNGQDVLLYAANW